ncbi:NCS2 family permease [Aeribacillus alveayuensis]|uniref:AGZA family xanthine/uracil permease-like MFS transporter n=1 Tax=Aeribacillus alveayuensis TaxID=279215 RepID=A0ABT9VML4_9BACI|nr:AGZA family xanthine/uracil permease-like MFS transporter [Bacillus alveayuensis]
MKKWFQLEERQTTIQKELLAGTVAFFTVVYIVAVNASILADAGIPIEAGILATVFSAVIGCLLMAFMANTPIIVVPGMGVNALFSYTICESMGLTWQEGLAVVFVSGILFIVISFTRLAKIISNAIPNSLKHAITAGIGIFLTFIGLQKGGIVVANEVTFVSLGHLTEAHVMATMLTLLMTALLFAKKVPGNFLLSIIFGVIIASFFGLIEWKESQTSLSWSEYAHVLMALSFERITHIIFWTATFSLTMVIVFENIGLIQGHTELINQNESYQKSLQANAISALTCGLLGSSPTVATAETAAAISSGGRTGLTAMTTAMLFIVSLPLLPYIKLIPDSAISPILIVIGALMMQSIQHINLKDFSESFPAFLIIALIPLTYSIVDGMAFGFIAYPILKLFMKRGKEIALPLYIIAFLFLINFIFHS